MTFSNNKMSYQGATIVCDVFQWLKPLSYVNMYKLTSDFYFKMFFEVFKYILLEFISILSFAVYVWYCSKS